MTDMEIPEEATAQLEAVRAIFATKPNWTVDAVVTGSTHTRSKRS